MTNADQWAFIEAKATELGVGEEARRKWRKRGVAYRYRLPIIEAARKAGVKIDPRIFDEPPVTASADAA